MKEEALNIDTGPLPVLWDANFLYGPKDASGEDTYVLCEINASSVAPFPDEALEPKRPEERSSHDEQRASLDPGDPPNRRCAPQETVGEHRWEQR